MTVLPRNGRAVVGTKRQSIFEFRLGQERGRVQSHRMVTFQENTMEGGYEGIVLSEDEFADRMIETMTGQYASLLHHYSKNTCLFVGLSLKDSILKNVLRQCATVTPGHYHYYVEYYEDSPAGRRADRDT